MNPTQPEFHRTGEATGFLPARDNQGKPITVIATEAIQRTFGSEGPTPRGAGGRAIMV